MASRGDDVTSDSASDENLNQGSSPGGRKTRKTLTAKGKSALKAVKRRLSPRKEKKEPLVDTPSSSDSDTDRARRPPPVANPPPATNPPTVANPPPRRKLKESDYLQWKSSSVTECSTESTSLSRSDSLYGVPEISSRRESSESYRESSEEKPDSEKASTSKSGQLPPTQEEG